MGFTTLLVARASHEIACRDCLTHLMNIGSPTLRFRSFSYLYPVEIRYA